jgi:hypothetical protein
MVPGYAASRRHPDAGDLDAAALILKWLKEDLPFYHGRFSDGEFYSMMMNGAYNGDRHPYFPEMGKEMIATLEGIAQEGRKHRVLTGGEWEYDPRIWQYILDHDWQDRVPWCPSHPIVQGILDGSTLEMFRTIRKSGHPKWVIGTSLTAPCGARCLKATPIIAGTPAYKDMPRVKRLLGELPIGAIVVWVAGLGCKPSVWSTFMRFPGTTQLDMGHIFDGAVGRISRTWLKTDNYKRRAFEAGLKPWILGGYAKED